MEIINKFIVERLDNYSGVYIEICTLKQGLKIDNDNISDYLNDKRHGLQRGWYSNGRLSYEANFVNGKQCGLQCSWYDNGQIIYKDNYLNGVLHGLQYSWNKKGQPLYIANYIHGKFVSKN